MPPKPALNKEQTQNVIEDWKHLKNNSVTAIAEKYNVGWGVIDKIINDHIKNKVYGSI